MLASMRMTGHATQRLCTLIQRMDHLVGNLNGHLVFGVTCVDHALHNRCVRDSVWLDLWRFGDLAIWRRVRIEGNGVERVEFQHRAVKQAHRSPRRSLEQRISSMHLERAGGNL